MYSRASELALPGMFRYLDARVRFFDGAVERALNAGVDQHLFLAAGYDTRAVRMATSEAAARLTAAKMRRQQKGGSGNGSGRGARASVASGGGDSAKFLGRAFVKGSAAATAAAAAVTSSPSSSTSPFAPRFFEVDLPHVSAAKRELVDSVLPDAERWPRPAFVGADLLDAAGALRALEAAGFDASASRPCLATLEGILMYLPPRSAREILRTVSTLLTPGSLLAFDFVVEECFATGGVGYEGASRGADGATTSSPPPAPSATAKTCPATDSSTYEIVDVPKEAEIAFPTYGLVASSVAHHGEPFRSGFEHAPERHAALAASLGFKVQELLDAPKVVETFFSGKKCTGPVSDYMAMALWEKL
jgi:O-methyltransferase involved in polyketide biosynthesis